MKFRIEIPSINIFDLGIDNLNEINTFLFEYGDPTAKSYARLNADCWVVEGDANPWAVSVVAAVARGDDAMMVLNAARRELERRDPGEARLADSSQPVKGVGG